MKVDNYSNVRLHDGREGSIIEVYDSPPRYCIEYSTPDGEHATDVDWVKPDDIAEVIRAV